MSVLVAVPFVLVLTLVIAVGQWLRSRRRDEKSIASHRSTLGVIEHVAGADETHARAHERATVHVRIVGGSAGQAPEAARDEVLPASRPTRRRGRPSFPLPRDLTLHPPDPTGHEAMPVPAVVPPRRPILDHEVAKLIAARARAARAAAAGRGEAAGAGSEREATVVAHEAEDVAGSGVASGPPVASAPARQSDDQPPARPAHRRAGVSRHLAPHHPLPVALAAAAVVVVLAAVIGVGLRSQGHRGRPPGGAARVASGASRPPGASSHKLPPATTVPPPPAVVATSATPNYATYTVNATALDLSLDTSGPCWVEVRNGSASGSLVYEGTVPAGSTQDFHVVGPVWMRLGDPAGTRLTIDGAAVALPATANPFDVTVSVPTGA